MTYPLLNEADQLFFFEFSLKCQLAREETHCKCTNMKLVIFLMVTSRSYFLLAPPVAIEDAGLPLRLKEGSEAKAKDEKDAQCGDLP